MFFAFLLLFSNLLLLVVQAMPPGAKPLLTPVEDIYALQLLSW